MNASSSKSQHLEGYSQEVDGVVSHTLDVQDITRKGALLRLFFFVIILATAIKPVWWSPGGDALSYVSIAKSLGEDGKLLRLGQTHLYHPPGVSFLYAPAFWFSSRPFVLMSVLQWLAATIALISCYHWFRRWLSRDRSILLTGVVFFNACSWGYYLRFLSEIWFCGLLFTVAALSPILSDALSKKKFAKGWGLTVLLTPLVIGLIMTRPVGVFIAGGIGISLFVSCLKWRNRSAWIHAFLIAVVLNLVAVTSAYLLVRYDQQQAVLNGSHTYTNQILQADQTFVQTLVDNVHRRINTVGRLFVPGCFRTYADTGDWLNPILLIYLPLTFMVCWGGVLLIRRHNDPFIMMAPLYVGMFLIWPYSQGTRFFIPILPLMVLAVYQLINDQKWCDKFLRIFLVLHLSVMTVRYVTQWPEALQVHQQWAVLDEIALVMKRLPLNPNEVFGSSGLDSDQVSMLSLVLNTRVISVERFTDELPRYLVLAPNKEQEKTLQSYTLIQQTHGYSLLKKE